MFPDAHMIGYTLDGMPALVTAECGSGGDSGEYEIPGEEPRGCRVFHGDRRYMGRGFFLEPSVGDGGDCGGGDE